MIHVTRFFGDRSYSFALTDPMIAELEAKADTGIGAIYQRLVAMQFKAHDLAEIIRLGLIGGGLPPAEAHRLTAAYAINRPFSETFPLALDILDARWGTENAASASNTAAATGDLSAALQTETTE